MPRPRSAFEETFPCDFYEPAELFDPDLLYTIPEIGRLLQGLEPDAEIDADTEAVLIDWAIPWVMVHADDMVVAEPPTDDSPGYYGLATDAATGSPGDDADAADER
ncbi:DUF5827 family protein [Halorubrum cibi]|uniref:Uncharacterized protein n=1 Tax=Halorubrum cibi TaxID=413815 RepID=A0A521B6F2_9EURY|nr:DUF5827 family protein [Halorubrum cibi]SMO42669.1 hypothetical protein SAMN06264867_10253 [Halorubrum cibi]